MPNEPPSCRKKLYSPVPCGSSVRRQLGQRDRRERHEHQARARRRADERPEEVVRAALAGDPRELPRGEREDRARRSVMSSRGSNLLVSRPTTAIETAVAIAPGSRTMPVCSAVMCRLLCRNTGSVNDIA